MRTKQTAQVGAVVFDLAHYSEVCDKCGCPARTELNISDYPNGHEWFQFCVNPRCVQFDYGNFSEFRAKLERQARESKSFRRFRSRLWRDAIKQQKQIQAHAFQWRSL